MFATGDLAVHDGDTDLNGVVDAIDLITVIENMQPRFGYPCTASRLGFGPVFFVWAWFYPQL